MKTISRYIMTLALLITAVGGAWAAETKVTIDAADYDATSSATSFSKEKDGITIAFSSAKKLTSYFELQSGTTVTITSTVGKIKSVVFPCAAMGTAKYGPGCLGSPTAGQYSYNDFTGTWTGDAESFTLTSTDKARFEKIDVTVGEADAPSDIDVTTNAASEQDLFTEASFTMPAFDATADYELVRDMSIQMTATMGDGTDGVRYRVKKAQQGQGYEPADMNMMQVMALVAVNDGIEHKDLTLDQDYFCRIYKLDEQTLQPEGDGVELYDFDFAPGLYALKAFAKDDSDYAGETALSNTFKLFQGYEVQVAAKEFITYYKDEPLYVEDEAAELYTIQSVSGDQAVLSDRSDAMPSNTPMLVYNKSNETKVILLIPCNEPNMAITVAPEFKGTLTGTTIAASTEGTTNYALNGKQFVYVKSDLAIGANKAYLSVPSAISNVKALTIVFGDATGIRSMDNGQWTMDTWYDLNGRKLNGMPIKKGIYILNGKKIVVK